MDPHFRQCEALELLRIRLGLRIKSKQLLRMRDTP
jgi:hypothetical protein